MPNPDPSWQNRPSTPSRRPSSPPRSEGNAPPFRRPWRGERGNEAGPPPAGDRGETPYRRPWQGGQGQDARPQRPFAENRERPPYRRPWQSDRGNEAGPSRPPSGNRYEQDDRRPARPYQSRPSYGDASRSERPFRQPYPPREGGERSFNRAPSDRPPFARREDRPYQRPFAGERSTGSSYNRPPRPDSGERPYRRPFTNQRSDDRSFERPSSDRPRFAPRGDRPLRSAPRPFPTPDYSGSGSMEDSRPAPPSSREGGSRRPWQPDRRDEGGSGRPPRPAYGQGGERPFRPAPRPYARPYAGSRGASDDARAPRPYDRERPAPRRFGPPPRQEDPHPQRTPDERPSSPEFEMPYGQEPTSPQERSVWLAAEVIALTSREKPADGVLREFLKQREELSPVEKRSISEAVYTYYRWKGWLTSKTPLPSRVAWAIELAARFRKNPFGLKPDVLRAKATPLWVHHEVEMNDDWLRSLQWEPRLWLRARPGQAKELAKKLGDCRLARPDALADAVEFTGHQDLYTTEEFQTGEFEIQDISSQAVSVLCAPQPGETWWDACAGEGGKLLHLSDLMQNQGLIWASDRAEWRLEKLKQRTARAKCFNYRAVEWDGGAKLPTGTKFDGVLVDAPCTGLGTWQRKPFARWTSKVQDMRELAELQKNLLANVAPAVKPGGKLIYAVCTLTRAETAGVAATFAAAHPEFEPLPLSLLPAGSPGAGASNTLVLWPRDLGGNGMFVAAWRRCSTTDAVPSEMAVEAPVVAGVEAMLETPVEVPIEPSAEKPSEVSSS